MILARSLKQDDLWYLGFLMLAGQSQAVPSHTQAYCPYLAPMQTQGVWCCPGGASGDGLFQVAV